MKNQVSNPEAVAGKYIRPIAFGTLSGIIVSTVALLITSAVLSIKDVPQMIIEPLAIAAACAGAFFSGMVCSRISGEKGFFLGLVCGVIMYMIILLCNLAISGQGLGFIALIKLLAMLISAGIGGILGVNRGGRRRQAFFRRSRN